MYLQEEEFFFFILIMKVVARSFRYLTNFVKQMFFCRDCFVYFREFKVKFQEFEFYCQLYMCNVMVIIPSNSKIM